MHAHSDVLKLDKIDEIFARFVGLPITVVGDIMLDEYIHGKVERISPEAPVPVVDIVNKTYCPGGAANVAVNLAALGAEVNLCSVTGDDENGNILLNRLALCGLSTQMIIRSKTRKTTCKTRILGNRHQMLRLDEENTHFLSPEEEEKLKKILISSLEGARGILLQDYDKGVLSPEIIRLATEKAIEKEIPVAVDPKLRSFSLYQKATLFKPNLKELKAGLGLPHMGKTAEELSEAHRRLYAMLNHRYTLITLSESGMYGEGPEGSFLSPAHLRNIADVSGAGDTVIAVATLCLAAGADFRTSVELANLAGGLVCEAPGAVTVNKDVLLKEAKQKLPFS